MMRIWVFIKAHKNAVIDFVGMAIIVGISFLAVREHDARTKADTTIKAAQTDIVALRDQQTTVAKAAKVKVSVLQKQAAKVNTPTKAVEVLTAPTPENMIPLEPLKAEAMPNAPGRVSVEALPLYQTLHSCSVDRVNLSACTQELDLQKRIDAKKDVQIQALKQKPNFWHRVGKFAKVAGCAGLGGAAGSYVKGAEGAAIGAAAGAGVCQLF